MKSTLAITAVIMSIIFLEPSLAADLPRGAGTPQKSATEDVTARHGLIDGSFTDGKLTLTEYVAKNGYHNGFPVVLIVDVGSHFTYVFQEQANDKVVEVFRASNAVGKETTGSPYGHFRVVQKLKWPSWIPPKSIDPKQKVIPPYNKTHKNPLGVARITLNKWDISLHGTNDPKSLRHSVSHGCIRHSNRDILSLYAMTPLGSEVILTRHLVGVTLTKADFQKRARRA
jgi:lipoprotein-anchoring transpeptidase ErfK/SrfK